MTITIAESKEAVKKALLEEEPAAKDIKVHEEFTEFVGSSVYYVEFKTPTGNQSDNFYYAMVDRNAHVQLLDDGVTALRELKDELDKIGIVIGYYFGKNTK